MSASIRRFTLVGACFLMLWGTGSIASELGIASSRHAPRVMKTTIDIIDPDLGPLKFDALAAGNPDAAQHGRLVLLLHGFPESAEEYREILPALAAAGYYAVAPSQRGYSAGARPLKDSDYTIDHMVRDTQAMATALGADRFHLVGHDWGGAIAWTLAANAPWRLNTLTVLSTPHINALHDTSTNPADPREYFLYARLFEAPGAANILLAGGPRAVALTLVAVGLPFDKAMIYANNLQDPVAFNAALAYYRANPLPPPYTIGLVTVPTLYAWGNLDITFSENDANMTGQYVLGPYRFVVLRGVNHWVSETDTERVAQLILSQVRGKR